MRILLDTNVAVSGLLWGGPPGVLIDAALSGRVDLVTSLPLIAELRGVVGRRRFSGRLARLALSAADVVDSYAMLAQIVTPATIAPTILRDPDDDQVLAAAVAGCVDLIVSGDCDLLDIRAFHGIPIVNAADAVALVLGARRLP